MLNVKCQTDFKLCEYGSSLQVNGDIALKKSKHGLILEDKERFAFVFLNS